MNIKRYKLTLLLTALPALYSLSWRGLAVCITVPAMPYWVLETRNTSGMIALALFAAAGLIVTIWQKDMPCPLPQMLMALLMSVGSILMGVCQRGKSLLCVLGNPLTYGYRVLQTYALFLPGVSAAGLLFTLIVPRARRNDLKMAFLNLLMLVVLSILTQSARRLLSMPTIAWYRYLERFKGLRQSAYGQVMSEVMQVYTSIPPLAVTAVGVAITVLLGREVYITSIGRLRRLSAQPVMRPVAQPVARAQATYQPRRGGMQRGMMSAADQQMLDQLARQTEEGTPFGLDLGSGTVGFQKNRN